MNDKIIEISRAFNPFSRENIILDDAGVPHYKDLPESLAAMLERHVRETPQTEAVVECGGRRVTYDQLWSEAGRIAGGLKARGLQLGDRVAILYPAGVKWVLAFWGVILAGGVAVAVNTRLTQSEIDYIISDAGAKLVLGRNENLPDSEPVKPIYRRKTDVVALFYTSGTTGKPKGVPFTEDGLMTSSRNMMEIFQINNNTTNSARTLISVPLFHVTGCNTQMMVMMYIGGTSVILPTFDKRQFLSELIGEKINYVITVPAIYTMIMQMPEFKETDTSSIKWLAYGGAPIAPTLVKALKRAFPNALVANGFGMTETTSIITALPDQDAIEYADSVGYAVPAIDIGVALADGETNVGELVARGSNVTKGYWNKDDETKKSYKGGWYWTGDIVRIDESGRVFLVDRKKDIIIRGGENISSVEIEAVLASIPGVAEAAALAVPDEVLGEKVGVIIRLNDQSLDISQILKYCQKQLAKYKMPQFMVITERPLPRSAAGKILKKELRETIVWGPQLQ